MHPASYTKYISPSYASHMLYLFISAKSKILSF